MRRGRSIPSASRSTLTARPAGRGGAGHSGQVAGGGPSGASLHFAPLELPQPVAIASAMRLEDQTPIIAPEGFAREGLQKGFTAVLQSRRPVRPLLWARR